MKYKYDKDELEIIIKSSYSISEVCEKMNIRQAGGNYKTIKKYIKLFDINSDHFRGQGWNTGERYKPFGKNFKLEEILIEESTYTNNNKLRLRLIKEGYKENRCEICFITKWNNKEIVCHLDHINGNNMDNRIENLRILCPNCHSQTETYCKGKKSQKAEFNKNKNTKGSVS